MLNEQLEQFIITILDNLNLSYDKIKVSQSNRPDLCDFQCNDLFKISKINQIDINELGQIIIDKAKQIQNYDDYLKDITFQKPGFLNLTVSNTLINKNLKEMALSDNFKIEKSKKQETFVIDYGGANVAKPLHIGHMRTAVIGESIKRIIAYKGHKVISDVHLGDYGLQIGQVIYGILKEGKSLDDIDIKYLDYIYPKMSALSKEDEKVKEECSIITKSLQDGNEQYQKIWQKIMESSVKDIKKNYDYLNVSFDYWYGESDAYKYLEQTKELLKEKNMLKEDDNALVVDIKEDKDNKEMPPFIFQKSNGAYLYESTDLATILQRKQDFNPNHILYVVDNRQSLHFEKVFRVSDKASIMPLESLEFLGYGTVNGKDGKPFKTRSGTSPKLENLFLEVKELFISKKESNKQMSNDDIDKIVNAILKFADLQNAKERDYIFDINKFSDTTGKTGPYILYTYLRLNKITNNEKINIDKLTNNIYNDYDRQLRLKMLELPCAYNQAYLKRAPHYIADYLYELCVIANSFYQQNHIKMEKNDETRSDWLNIITVAQEQIKEMLKLLGIEIPIKM